MGKNILADTSSFKNPLLLSDEFESELSKLGKASFTEIEMAEILFGQAENIYQEHRNYSYQLAVRWKRFISSKENVDGDEILQIGKEFDSENIRAARRMAMADELKR